MTKETSVDNSYIVISVPESFYSKEVILKALYWYGDKFSASIEFDETSRKFAIELRPNPSLEMNFEDLQLYESKLHRDLIDFSLRETINAETQSIREILLAKAFSNGEFDESPPGEVSDPVGFNPNLV